MVTAIPKHPIPMKTRFRKCFLVNFGVSPAVMRRILPAPLEPDLHNDEAFLSVVIAAMEKMRPAFLPAAFGVTYLQVVYRVVVRCRGRRGVFFIRSDANHRFMCLMGNLLTFFRFNHSTMSYRQENNRIHFDLQAAPSHHADIQATFDLAQRSDELPATSTFETLYEAQQFLVELFAAFSPNPDQRTINVVRIKRGEWDIKTVPDCRASYQLMASSDLFTAKHTRLDSVFYVVDLPYYWHTLEQISWN